jgi:hypothetical protein
MRQITARVGLLHRRQQVTNHMVDQQTVADLLAHIPQHAGGTLGLWPPHVLFLGSPGQCTGELGMAIWAFQERWQRTGELRVVDGVVDPGGSTLKALNTVAALHGYRPAPLPDMALPKISFGQRLQRFPGTWQVSGVGSMSVGEGGQVGSVSVEITEPSGQRFTLDGVGAGVGVGIDPIGVKKLLARTVEEAALATGRELLKMVGTSVLFSVGDYLQAIGIPLSSMTGGRIVLNSLRLGHAPLSRYLLTGGSARQPFIIAAAGVSFIGGGEAGIMGFGPLAGLGLPFADAIALYGSAGVTLKAQASAGVMIYHCLAVRDTPA